MPNAYQPGSDAELVQQAVHGDKQAFGRLFEVYYEQIYKYLLIRMNTYTEAEDLAETVFLKAWQFLPSFGQKGKAHNFRAWLYRIAHNALIDHRRTRKPETILAVDIPDAGEMQNPDETFEKGETFRHISQAIAALDDTSQHVIIGRFLAGLSHKEISQTLGVSEGNVRIVQYRAIRKIREMLGDENE